MKKSNDKKYQYILFDLDGTLTDPYEGITKCFMLALKHFGVEKSQEELLPVIGPPLIDSFCNMFGFNKEKGELAVIKYRERYDKIGWKENKLLDGVPNLLKSLKNNGKKIALATSKPHIFADRILKEYDIHKYFDVIVGAELNGVRNSKKDVILKVIDDFKECDLSQMIMIGDRKYDIEGAKSVGIDSIGIKTGYAEENELENAGAEYIIDTISDLTDFLINH